MEPLNAPVTTLPHFMPNQVLTETQLNGVVDYLEQQERFTRERLIGIGIVCGLRASIANKIVTVSKGVGISSEGYLLNWTNDGPLTKQRTFVSKNYQPFANLQDPCYELLPDNTAAADAVMISFDPANVVFVLFLDYQDKPNGKCLGQDCDEKGNSYVFTLRVLVMTVKDAGNVIRNACNLGAGNSLDTYFNPAYSLPTVFIERFGALSDDPTKYFDLPNVQDFARFEKDYAVIIANGAQRLDAAIAAAFGVINTSFMFKNIFDKQLGAGNLFTNYNTTTISALCAGILGGAVGKTAQSISQYVYDFLRDLIDTYHELREELFAYYAACCPGYGLFPRHLFLGFAGDGSFGKLIPGAFEQPYHYRDKFIPSLAETIEVQYFRKMNQLIQRMALQINEFDPSVVYINPRNQGKDPISIIPDKNHAAPLGDRSIPFYYNDKEQSLYKYWNYDKLVQNRASENRSYFPNPPGLNNIYATSPVLFDIAKYPKFTIQGHVGLPLSQAVTDLQDQRLKYNLSFDILLLKLGSLNTGGIIADDNLISDLQAQYMAYRNELVCCVEDLIVYIEKNGQMIAEYFVLLLEAIINNQNPSANTLQTIGAAIVKLLETFNLSLELMIKSLPTDIKLFRFQKLYEIYPAVSTFTSIFKLAITTWGDLEGFFVKTNAAGTKGAITIAELVTIILNMWELYLDKIADDCVLANFLTIHELYQERVNTFAYFSEFNQQVHGMEHISGTTNGGTLVLVYDNATRPKKVYNGQVVSENGHALAGAWIMDAADNSVVFGKTDTEGMFHVSVPDNVETLAVQHKDFTYHEIPLTESNVGKAKLYSHESYVKDVNINLPPVASKTDKVYIQMMSAASQVKEMAATAAPAATGMKKVASSNAAQQIQANMLAEVLNIRKPSSTFNSTVVNSKTEFVVVADFSLPHLIHNYKTRVAPFDACKQLQDVKLIDFTAISALLSKSITTKGSKLTETVYLARQNAGS
jgi:hypothetical protein